MPDSQRLILGEFRRKLDERHRLLIPKPLAEPLVAESAQCILAKERPGCISLWPARAWQPRLEQGVRWIEQKLGHEKLEAESARLQQFGRLLDFIQDDPVGARP